LCKAAQARSKQSEQQEESNVFGHTTNIGQNQSTGAANGC
jgi:hypothetical protein